MKPENEYIIKVSNHNDGFRPVDPCVISSKYSMYKPANTGDNGDPIANLSSYRYILDPISK